MNVVFADTYYYLALHNPDDRAHAPAVAFSGDYRGAMVTTWGVLLEIADGLSRKSNREKAAGILTLILNDSATTVVPLDESRIDRGFRLYQARLDKDWSLTDCVSFEVMTELELTEALTGDHHFEQAGFRALLRSENDD